MITDCNNIVYKYNWFHISITCNQQNTNYIWIQMKKNGFLVVWWVNDVSVFKLECLVRTPISMAKWNYTINLRSRSSEWLYSTEVAPGTWNLSNTDAPAACLASLLYSNAHSTSLFKVLNIYATTLRKR